MRAAARADVLHLTPVDVGTLQAQRRPFDHVCHHAERPILPSVTARGLGQCLEPAHLEEGVGCLQSAARRLAAPADGFGRRSQQCPGRRGGLLGPHGSAEALNSDGVFERYQFGQQPWAIRLGRALSQRESRRSQPIGQPTDRCVGWVLQRQRQAQRCLSIQRSGMQPGVPQGAIFRRHVRPELLWAHTGLRKPLIPRPVHQSSARHAPVLFGIIAQPKDPGHESAAQDGHLVQDNLVCDVQGRDRLHACDNGRAGKRQRSVQVAVDDQRDALSPPSAPRFRTQGRRNHPLRR